jgi:CRP-like cAMP-binding protein
MTAERGGRGLASALGDSPELVAMRADGLATMAVFEGCTPEQLTRVARLVRPVNAQAGQVLMRQGERAVSFILIQSGAAQVCHVGDDGGLILDEVPAGVIVGEIALLRDKPRTATVTATEPLSGYIGDEKAFAAMAASRAGPPAYDGIAELWWDSLEDMANPDPAARTAALELLEDERRFIDLARSPLFLVNEQTVVPLERKI